jgi:hypothetical protein
VTPDEAIDTVARHYISHIIRTAMDAEYSGWEDYPEIGQHDWTRVVERAEAYVPAESTKDSYDEAYELLADRAADDGVRGKQQ